MTLHCYHCCHSIDTNDLGLPVSFVNGTFNTVGHFCSWECMKAYVVYSRDDTKFNKFSLITMMRQHMNLFTPVKEAPPREMLDIFGGNMSIDEFRNQNESYVYLPLPMIRLNPLIEKNTNISCVTQEDANKVYETSVSELKLQRKKKSPVNVLEKSMGLIKQN